MMPKEESRKEHIMDDEPLDYFLGDSRKWIVIIIVLLVLLGIIMGYYIHALKSVRMESMGITEIKIDEGKDIVALDGEMRLYNPSALPLDIEGISYDITIDDMLIGSGRIYGDRIPSGRETTMRFEQDINLFEAVPDVITRADENRVAVMMRGTITMVFLGVHVKLPFREEQDITPLIESQITAITTRQKDAVEDIISRSRP